MNVSNETDSAQLSPFVGLHLHPAARATFAAIASAMILCGVTGNALLLTVIFGKFRPKRYSHDLFIASLALADSLTLGYWLTFFVLDLALGYHPVVNQTHCLMNGMIFCLSTTVCILSLLAISVNRYLYVAHSHLYRRVFLAGPHCTTAICAGIWIVALVVVLPPALHIDRGVYFYSPYNHVCTLKTTPLSYGKIAAALFSFTPMLVVGYCNFSIFRFWKKAQDELKGWNVDKGGTGKSDRESGSRESGSSRWWKRQSKDRETDVDERPPPQSLASTSRYQNEKERRWNMETTGALDPQSSVSTERCLGEKENVTIDRKEATPIIPQDYNEGFPSDDKRSGNETEDTIETKWHLEKTTKRKKERYVETTPSDSFETTSFQNKTETEEKHGIFQENDDSGQTNFLSVKDPDPQIESSTSEVGLETMTMNETTIEVIPMQTSKVFGQSSSHSTKRHSRKSCSKKTGAKRSVSSAHKKPSVKEMAFLRSLFVVFLLACISFIPFSVVISLTSVVVFPEEVRISTFLLMVFNNSVNWVVYGVMSPSFRKAYQECGKWLLGKCCPWKRKVNKSSLELAEK